MNTRCVSGSSIAVLGLLLLVLPGCSSSQQGGKTVRVRGQVLVNGQPAAGAMVQLFPADGQTLPLTPTAEVQNDGSFALSTYQPGDGVPEGEYLVTVVWKEKRRSLGKSREFGPDKLNGAYADREKTSLRVHITPKTPDAIFQLTVP